FWRAMFEWTLVEEDWPLCLDAQDALVEGVPPQSWEGLAPRPILDKGGFRFIGHRKFLTPKEVLVWAGPRGVLLVRAIPVGLALQCTFKVMSGSALATVTEHWTGESWASFPLPEGVTAMSLHRRVRDFGLKTGLLTSRNQDVHLHVGSRRLRKDAGILWEKSFATRPPRRTSCKEAQPTRSPPLFVCSISDLAYRVATAIVESIASTIMAAAAVWSRPPLVAYVLQYLDLITQAQCCSISAAFVPLQAMTAVIEASKLSHRLPSVATFLEAARVVWGMVTGPLLHLDGQSLKCPGLAVVTTVEIFLPHWDGCRDLPRAVWQAWIGRPDEPKDAQWTQEFLGARGLSRDVLKGFVELNFDDEDIELAMAPLRQGRWTYHCYPGTTGQGLIGLDDEVAALEFEVFGICGVLFFWPEPSWPWSRESSWSDDWHW
ncbi:unnamed protein product, partial [Durusdinium trenchii]